jgi:uncharacterized membrane protein HdeD (DUF308 family)
MAIPVPEFGLITAILAIVFGIVVIIWPRVLAYLIAIYLIIIGIIYFVQRYLGWFSIVIPVERQYTVEALRMSISSRVAAVLAIVFGIIILVFPQVLAVLVGVWLIIAGVLYFVKR